MRQRLGFQIVAELTRPDGTLPLIQLAPEWEERFLSHQVEAERGRHDVALPPELFNALTGGIATEVNTAMERGITPAVITSTQRRRFLRMALAAKQVHAPVLSFEEIGVESQPALVGVVAA